MSWQAKNWHTSSGVARYAVNPIDVGEIGWHVPEPEAMGVVLDRRFPLQRLMTTIGTTPFKARKTRLSGTCHPIFPVEIGLTALSGTAAAIEKKVLQVNE